MLHAMLEYEHYDKVLIVAGDGDFYCLVDFLLRRDKLLKLMIPNREKHSSLFRKMMKHTVFMNELQEKLQHKRNEGTKG